MFDLGESILNIPKKKKSIANEVGCLLCPLNKTNNSFSKTTPLGSEVPSIYVLSSFSGEIGIIDKFQLEQNSVNLVLSALKLNLTFTLKDVARFNSCIRCSVKGQRSPENVEVECCRVSIEKDIELVKPKVILGLGDVPLKWVMSLSHHELWRGRKAVVTIGAHTCYFISTYSPLYLSQLKEGLKEDYISIFNRDVKEAVKIGLSKDVPKVISRTEYLDEIEILLNPNFDKVKKQLEFFKTKPLISIDLETKGLSPYKLGFKVLSISISCEDKTFAFPLSFKNFWGDKEKDIYAILEEFIIKSSTKICHNLKFELAIFNFLFSNDVIFKTNWKDSMLLAYALDERTKKLKDGPLSLNALIKFEFGFNLKDLSDVDVTDLENESLDKVLTYNGLDSKYTFKLYEKLYNRFKKEPSLNKVYEILLNTTKSLVIIESNGVCVDFDKVEQYKKEILNKIDIIDKGLQRDENIVLYEKRFGKFNASSPAQVGILLKDILKLPNIKGDAEDEDFGTDKDSLKQYEAMGATCVSKVLDRRSLLKLYSTYLEPLIEYVGYDKRLRTSFNQAFTSTGRLCVSKGTYIQTVRDFSKYPKGTLIEDVKEGDLVYTYDVSKKLTIKKVLWAGKTGIKKVIRIHWRGAGNKHSGFLDVTPEHRIRKTDGSYVKACSLKKEDSILALHITTKEKEYAYLYITGVKSCVKNSRFVYENINNCVLTPIQAVHHKDENKLNDTSSNLSILSINEHAKYHSLILSNIKERKEKFRIVYKDLVSKGKLCQKGEKNKNYINLTKIQCLRILAKTRGALINAPFDFAVIKDRLVKHRINSKLIKLRYCGKRKEYISKSKLLFLLKEQNYNFIKVMQFLKCDYYKFKKLLKHYEIVWESYKLPRYNHKIVKIEELNKEVEVYDIEVEDTHNFIANELCVHNCSLDPNLQNQPRRTGGYIRNIIVPPKDYYFVASDLGQIEARFIAIASQDLKFMEAIKEGYDVHKYWAIEIAKLQPEAAGIQKGEELAGKALKNFRDRIKNEMVFPLFYGSSKYSVRDSLELSDSTMNTIFDKFWKMFKGVREWQKRTHNFYNKQGYVVNLIGRKRHAPIGYTQIINTPIQSITADYIFEVMYNIIKIAYNNGLKDLTPILQIHDDLSFYVHKDRLDESIVIIAKEMCRPVWDCINIPLSVEIKIGTSWGTVEEVAKFSTTDFTY